jgi:hypothetical protein
LFLLSHLYTYPADPKWLTSFSHLLVENNKGPGN